MAKADLTAQRLREILAYDQHTGVFTWKMMLAHRRKPGDIAGSLSHGYIEIGINNHSYRAHRLAWLHSYGEWPIGQIDHIDGNRVNNAIANLRVVTNQKNSQNRHRVSTGKITSEYLGVTWNAANSCWMAQIKVGGKNQYIGQYSTEYEAHIAYLHRKRIHHEGADICNQDLPQSPQRLNRHRRSSDVTGVSFDRNRNKWCAKPLINGKRKHVGYFTTEADAIAAVKLSKSPSI